MDCTHGVLHPRRWPRETNPLGAQIQDNGGVAPGRRGVGAVVRLGQAGPLRRVRSAQHRWYRCISNPFTCCVMDVLCGRLYGHGLSALGAVLCYWVSSRLELWCEVIKWQCINTPNTCHRDPPVMYIP